MSAKPITASTVVTSAFLNDLVGVYDRSPTTVDVNTSVAETTVYSKSIGANHMGSDRALVLRLVGDYQNLTGGSATITMRVKFGATTLYTIAFNGAVTAGRIQMDLPELLIANQNATNAQVARHLYNDTSHVGGGSDFAMHESAVVFAAEDTTSAKTLAVTVQHGTSSASISYRKLYAVLELL